MKLKPIEVFDYFKALSNIPRGSGNEKQVSDYLYQWGKNQGYESVQDEHLNVIIKVPPTKGYEKAPTIILQGHMDMVCEKGENSSHDFYKDPIEWMVQGDLLTANDTTLGADDGIGVAMAMALAKTDHHGPLTILITVSEETDMSGAKGLDPIYLQGDYLINIDVEEEGYLTASSAGGLRYDGIYRGQWEEGETTVLKLNFGGLLGGHSGMEIQNPKGNMIRIMADFVAESGGRLVSFDAGTKHNAIPRTGELRIEVSSEKTMELIQDLKEKYAWTEGNLTIEWKEENYQGKLQTKESTLDFAQYLLSLPTGAKSFIDAEQKFVESSSNLAIVSTKGDQYIIFDSIRFAKSSLQDQFKEEFTKQSQKHPVDFEFTHYYPEWAFREESQLRNTASSLYEELTGKELGIVITHGGLECGVFYKKNPQLDIIAIGPDITGAHTPKETLSISSTKRVYEFLVRLLEQLQ